MAQSSEMMRIRSRLLSDTLILSGLIAMASRRVMHTVAQATPVMIGCWSLACMSQKTTPFHQPIQLKFGQIRALVTVNKFARLIYMI